MARSALIIAIWLSGVGLAATVLLAVSSNWINAWDHRLTLNDNFHVGIWALRSWNPCLVFFNDADGPYRGSIMGLVDDNGNRFPRDLEEWGFGDSAGMYFRHFLWRKSNATLWTLAISLWYLIALFTILPMWAVVRFGRRYRDESRIPQSTATRL